MPILALAGGTSPSLGRAIFTAILSNKNLSNWQVRVLSRSPRPPTWLRAVDPTKQRHGIQAVDYASVESLSAALEDVHTVISVTSAVDGTQAQTQINLLHAAVRAGCLRFSPSQWGFGPKGWENVGTLEWVSRGVQEECIRYSDRIEVANFNQGQFMNYLGHGIFANHQVAPEVDDELQAELSRGGGYRAGEDEVCQGLHREGPLADGSGGFLVGLSNGIAELPIKADGSWPRVTFTTLRDVGRFVAASLDLPKWERDMSMVGETVTLDQLLALAEVVTGKRVSVTVLHRAELEARLAQSESWGERLWIEFNLAYIRDAEEEAVLRPIVNDLCPEVKPTGVHQYLQESWNLYQQALDVIGRQPT